ncbi:hypothetical protein [Paenibacillus kobensis]|uniref:hypothetical protein n=1 Tax=Paenibacillus kobensis TaxID=59841 RepID=UPI000FD8BDC1|nr:hypothetical protein [Paenibacillus kobensis]
MHSLSIDFKNVTTKKPAFYQSNDPAQNVLTLTVSNYTGSAVTFPAGSSKLRIGFGSLLSAAEVNAITINRDAEWSAAQDNASRGAAVVLSPVSDVQLGVNASFSLNVTFPSISEQPASGNLTILSSGVEGTDDDENVLRFFILKPPSGKPVLPLNAGWLSSMPAVVYVSPDSNHLLASSLGLFLSNTSDSSLAADPDSAGSNPRFLISFPTIARPGPHEPLPNPGMNALTYDDLAKDIGMRVIGDGNNNWSLTPAYGSSNESLVWELKPLTPGILGGGQAVEVMIDHIRTVLPPFTTAVHIQYVDIPGYDDSIVTLHLQKSNPEPGIMSFYSDAPNIELGDSAALNWSTFAVHSLELSYSVDGKTVVKSSDNGDIALQESGYQLPLDKTTTYTLTAYAATGENIQKQLTVTVNELDVSMVIQPLTLEQGGIARMTWKVTGSDQATCTLDPGGIQLPLSGSDYKLQVDATTSYTITATNSKRQPPVSVAQTTVSVMPVHINSFVTNHSGPVDAGTEVLLSWDVDFPSTLMLVPADGLNTEVYTALQPKDSVTVRPRNNTTYTLTATGFNGPVQQQVHVMVNSVEITEFSVSPSNTQPGAPATLSWAANRAVTASLDGQTPLALPGGSMTVNPQRDTTYTLTCTGPNGPVSKSVTLTTNCVKITELYGICIEEQQGYCMWSGAKIQVHWTVENAAAAVLYDINDQVPIPVAFQSGQFVFRQANGTHKYRLIAEGPAGPVQQDLVWSHED